MVDPSRTDELRDAIELLFFGYRAFTGRPDRILERRGLGRVHHRILYFVGRNPDISVKGLLDILSVTKQAMNAPLRQLLEMHLIAVMENSQDRRVKKLRLTQEGQRLEAELTGVQTRLLQGAFDKAGGADEAGWRRILATLADAGP